MKKRFNDTGACIPEKHYMVDISNKTSKILKMIEQGDYFVINKPRQYGKTTTIHMLSRHLKALDDYFPIKISFEGIGSESYKSEAAFTEAFILRLKHIFKMSGNKALVKFIRENPGVDAINKLDIWLTELVMEIGKKTVLMIDEVDKSSNNQLFLDFLGMLRDKYIKAGAGDDVTFHSAILVGVHDVKSLKVKIRPDDETRYNSPWNIAVDFNVDLSFSPQEIASMLEQYQKERQLKIDISFFTAQLFYFTSGYPFLVSYLCKIIDEEILPGKKQKIWEPH
ncbi:MAG: AAA family ATPase, partial [bacterium]|nr:AAA family ATPase [bacterium]